MVRPQVVDLLLPAGIPEVFTDEFDRVQGIGEEAVFMTQAMMSLWHGRKGYES